MGHVLIIEDSPTLSRGMARLVRGQANLVPVTAMSLSGARLILDSAPPEEHFMAALVDMHLPDAEGTDILDALQRYQLPIIVFTADYDAVLHAEAAKRQVVEYLLKDSPAVGDYVVRLLQRLDRNRHTKVLVVDGSRLARASARRRLERHNLVVFEAESGELALQLLDAQQGVSLVLTALNLPGMDADELSRKIRHKYPRKATAIIGVWDPDHVPQLARFLKGGASDILMRDCADEVFHLRVMQNLELLEHLQSAPL
ncbi:MAG: response regulator [Deltaproteobacteria bacterium]|nr:response regulator [Deltaproteobacteria bacterium]